jgi:hypothetical protein
MDSSVLMVGRPTAAMKVLLSDRRFSRLLQWCSLISMHRLGEWRPRLHVIAYRADEINAWNRNERFGCEFSKRADVLPSEAVLRMFLVRKLESSLR